MTDTDKVLQTREYDKFKELSGNRPVDEHHVSRIKRSMLDNGNLTQNFPLVVNESMEIIDGQHRLAALRELEWPVFYKVQKGLNLTTVRAINQAMKNWSWKDYAQSYASMGAIEYQNILKLYETFNYGLRILLSYAGDVKSSGREVRFVAGDFKFKVPLQEAIDQLNLANEVADVVEKTDREFIVAMHAILNNPQYDHAHMLRKAGKFGKTLRDYKRTTDYWRELEDIYNYHEPEENRVRFF